METMLNEDISPQSMLNLDKKFQEKQGSQKFAKNQLKTMMLIKNMNDVPSVPSTQEMERAYGDNLDQMFTDHNTLISRILNEEE